MHYLWYTFYLKIPDFIATAKLLGAGAPLPPNGDAPASLQPSGNVLIESYYLERETIFIIAHLIIRFYKRDIVNAWWEKKGFSYQWSMV